MDDRKSKQETRLTLEAFEIESLNIDSLNVDELEQRLELSTGVPTTMGWVCDCDNYTVCNCDGSNTCSTYCGHCATYCGLDCSTDCSADIGIEFPEEPIEPENRF